MEITNFDEDSIHFSVVMHVITADRFFTMSLNQGHKECGI